MDLIFGATDIKQGIKKVAEVTNEQLLNRLVENALDFLSTAITELKDTPKLSVIHFHAALELFVKSRLMAEHWSLIVSKRQEPDWDRLVSGDFQSVTLNEAANRLSNIVRSGLSNKELEVFGDVAKHRNKMVHFFHEAHSDDENNELKKSISIQQLHAWYYLHRLLRNKWGNVFEPWFEQIAEIDKALRKLHEFLLVVYENSKPEIKKRRKDGSLFESCPSCGFQSREHPDIPDEIYESVCIVCELSEKHLKIDCPNCEELVIFEGGGFSTCDSCSKKFEPDDVAGMLLDDGSAYCAAKEGDDSWDLGNCSECDSYNTVVRIEDKPYVCANCFSEFDSLGWCQWCNEPNTGDMEHSYWSGCNVCDGKAGWDRDD